MSSVFKHSNKFVILLLFGMMFGAMASASVISVDEITYDTDQSGSFYSGDLFVLGINSRYQDEVIQATVQESQLNNAVDSENDVTGQIDIYSEVTEENIAYQTQDTGRTTVWDLEIIQASKDYDRSNYDGWQDFANKECYQASEVGYSDPISATWDVVCATRTGDPIGQVYDFSAPDYEWEADFEVSGEVSTSATVGNGDTGQGTSTDLTSSTGQKFGEVRWEGNLDSGDQLEDGENTLALYDANDDSWKLISENEYEDWYNYVHEGDATEDYLDVLTTTSTTTTTVQNSLENGYETQVQGVFSGSSIYGGSWDSGTYKLSPTQSPQFPRFTLYLAGTEYVTIEKVGFDPNIVDVSPEEPVPVYEGSDTPITFQVENNENTDGLGTAEAQMTCSEGFEVQRNTQTISVEGGQTSETKSFNVGFSDGNDQVTSGTCDLTVENSNGPQSDSITLDVEGRQDQVCQPNWDVIEGRDDGDDQVSIKRCQGDGMGYNEPRTCDLLENEIEVKSSSPYQVECVSTDGDDDDGPFSLEAINDVISGITDSIDNAIGGPIGNIIGQINTLKSFTLAMVSVLSGLLITSVARNDFLPQLDVEEPIRGIVAAIAGITATVVVFAVVSNIIFQILAGLAVLLYIYIKIQTAGQA